MGIYTCCRDSAIRNPPVLWLTLAFPGWVFVVSVLILLRSGFIDDQRAGEV
jgi:hypothetical protein